MPARRFLPPGKEAAPETKASHEVMDLVRKDPELSLLVVQLHEAGHSWPDVKAAVEAKTEPAKRSSSGDVLRLARHRLPPSALLSSSVANCPRWLNCGACFRVLATSRGLESASAPSPAGNHCWRSARPVHRPQLPHGPWSSRVPMMARGGTPHFGKAGGERDDRPPLRWEAGSFAPRPSVHLCLLC
jgi:hypothetical protein